MCPGTSMPRPKRAAYASFHAPEKAGGVQALVHRAETGFHRGSQQADMRDATEIIWDFPYILLGSHPIEVVEALEVYRAGIAAERFFALRIIVVLKVGHRELAKVFINRLTVSEARVVRLGDGSPAALLAEDGENVIVVANGFEVDQERRKSEQTQRGGTEKSAFHAVPEAIAEDAARRAATGAVLFLVVPDLFIEKALDLFRRS